MLKKSRLFIFGDSWGANLYRCPDWIKANLNPLPPQGIPYHLEDYLRYNYEVYNFAEGGAPNTEIIYQLSNLPNYEPGDRILIMWSHFIRHSLWGKDGGVINYGDFNLPAEDNPKSPLHAPKEIYASLHGRLNQLVLAEQTPLEEIELHKIKDEFRFYTWITQMLSMWGPIAVTWEPTLAGILKIPAINYSAEFFKGEKVTIKDEYGLEDGHLGGRGNYLLYRYILNLLDSTAEPMDQVYRAVLPEVESTKDEKSKILH